MSLLALITLLVTATENAGGPPAVPEADLTLNFGRHYLATFRDNTWCAIDLIVDNTERDISGHIELRTFSPVGFQSPSYSIPVVSPKNSIKRFRMHCQMLGTTRIEAMLYHDDRPALSVPVGLDVRPIAERSLVVMVLDDEPTDYTFLYPALQQDRVERNIYREDFIGAEFSMLPDHPRAYDNIDLVVLGETDPGAISPEQRAAMIRYVEEGGVLVVNLGGNAPRYRATWIEDLAGIAIGDQKLMKESELATVFAESERAGVQESLECVVTQMTPARPDIEAFGNGPVLASLRSLGNGYVAVIAIDAVGGGLQEVEGYRSFWLDLVARGRRGREALMPGVVESMRNILPRISGIRIVPRKLVLRYLGLYFLIGVVFNWVFWSVLKRREWAWVCLAILSCAFTGYAVVAGTAGRIKASEYHEVKLVRLPERSTQATLRGFLGILSPATDRYTLTLNDDRALASDPINRQGNMGGFPGLNMVSEGFTLAQTSPPRIEDLVVNANVPRVLELSTALDLEGGIEGFLTVDGVNQPRGTFTNNTGLQLETPFIFLGGVCYELVPGDEPDVFRVGPSQPLALHNYRIVTNAGQDRELYGAVLPSLLYDQVEMSSQALLCGTLAEGAQPLVQFDREIAKRVDIELFAAAIPVATNDGETRRERRLTVRTDTMDRFDNTAVWQESGRYSGFPSTPYFNVHIPPELMNDRLRAVILDFTFRTGDAPGTLYLHGGGIAVDTIDPASSETSSGGSAYKKSIRLDNWQDLMNSESGDIRLEVTTDGGVALSQRVYTIVLEAKAEITTGDTISGGWASWPLSKP